jgi:hypothetical protein
VAGIDDFLETVETIVIDGQIRRETDEYCDALIDVWSIGDRTIGQILADHIGKVAHVVITLRTLPPDPFTPIRHWWDDREIPGDQPEEDV